MVDGIWLAFASEEQRANRKEFAQQGNPFKEIQVLRHYDYLDIFRETTTYRFGGNQTVYQNDAFVVWNKKGGAEEIKSLVRITQYAVDKSIVSDSWRVTTGYSSLTPGLKDFVSVVEKYRSGDFIGDQRGLRQKYIDFIFAPTLVQPKNSDVITGPYR